jgi:light-regulated signal transduction histidine kinase (bacteriophytochrome)
MVSDSVKRHRVSATIALMHAQTAIVGLFNEMQVPLTEVVAHSASALLRLANATGGAVWLRDRVMSFGIWPNAALGASIVDSVRSALARSADGVHTTERVDLLPGLGPSDTETVCGAMAVELGASGSAGIVWIRPEHRREVNWGGDPEKSMQIEHGPDGKIRVSPRSSFAQWRTLVKGRCRPWSDTDREAARALLPLGQLLLVRESLARVGLFETP